MQLHGVRGERTGSSDDVEKDLRIQYGGISQGGGLAMDWHGWDQMKSGCGLQ